MDKIVLFTYAEGNLFVRLLIAHLIADFVLQTGKMVHNKKTLSGYMLLHILIVFLSTFLLSGALKLSVLVAFIHWLTDATKVTLQPRYPNKQKELFIADQVVHILTLVGVWFAYCDLWHVLSQTISLPFTNYTFSILVLAYLWLIYPVGYLIKYATQNITKNTIQTDIVRESNIEHGGKLIGQFERIIILTLVLLNQYEAIGFLITGKSIIRFADHNSNLRSEYVLVGTMMSYAIAILTGVCVNYLFPVN